MTQGCKGLLEKKKKHNCSGQIVILKVFKGFKENLSMKRHQKQRLKKKKAYK